MTRMITLQDIENILNSFKCNRCKGVGYDISIKTRNMVDMYTCSLCGGSGLSASSDDIISILSKVM